MNLNKKIFGLSLFMIITIPLNMLFGQVERSKPPEPGPAPEIRFGEPASFTLENGLKVFVVEDHSIPKVSYQISLENDPVLEKDAVGYVNIAGDMLRRGTKNRSKTEIDQAVDFIGADLSTFSSGMYGASLKKHTDKLLTIMEDVLLNPSFPEDELKKVKNQTISGIEASQADPNSIASNVRKVLMYGKGHPYGEIPTKESVNNVTVAKCRQYYEDYFRPNNAYLMVVGDITEEEAKSQANKYFGSWQNQPVPENEYTTPQPPKKSRVAMVNRNGSVQSVIMMGYPLQLKPGSEDYIEATVMNSMLGGRAFSSKLMQNIREDKGYSYGAYSSLNADRYVGNFYATSKVRNSVTDSTIQEILKEMKTIRRGELDSEQLEIIKNMKAGDFARSLENPRTIAEFALNIERYGLPADYYRNYLKNLKKVSKADVKQAAQKYIKPDRLNIVVVGSADGVEDKLKKFGQLNGYDKYGNKIKTQTSGSKAGKSVPVKQILEDYYAALGGKEKIAEVKNLITKSTFKMSGRKIQNTTIQKSPDKFINKTTMNSRVLSKQVYNDGKGLVVAQGKQRTVEGKMLKRMQYSVYPFKELKYDELGFQTENMGLEKVNGEQAYKIKITSPEGIVTFDFFSKETGLKLKTVRRGGPTMVYEKYKEVKDIKFPHSLYTETQSGSFNATVTSIKINPKISDDRFSIK